MLLTYILIHAYSRVGSAIFTIISFAFNTLLSNAKHPKIRKIFRIQMKTISLLKQQQIYAISTYSIKSQTKFISIL